MEGLTQYFTGSDGVRFRVVLRERSRFAAVREGLRLCGVVWRVVGVLAGLGGGFFLGVVCPREEEEAGGYVDG